MYRRTLVTALAGTLWLVTGCHTPEPVSPLQDRPVFAQVPAAGNGNKLVFPFAFDLQADCNGEILANKVVGWVQVRVFDQPKNRNIELDVFHSVATYTNSAGETFVFHDVGPDHYYLEDGNLIVAITGRSTGSGVIGHVVVNLSTGEVELIAGSAFGTVDAIACAALT